MQSLPSRRSNDKITHSQRLAVIYFKTIHSMPLKDIQARTGLNYHSVRNILKVFRNSGRTNKKAYRRPKITQKRTLELAAAPVSPASETFAETPSKQWRQPNEESSQDTSPTGSSNSKAEISKNQGCIAIYEAEATGGEAYSHHCKLLLVSALEDRCGSSDGIPIETHHLTPASSLVIPVKSTQEEMASSDIRSYEKLGEAKSKYFTGPLAYLNQEVVTGSNGQLRLKRQHLVTMRRTTPKLPQAALDIYGQKAATTPATEMLLKVQGEP